MAGRSRAAAPAQLAQRGNSVEACKSVPGCSEPSGRKVQGAMNARVSHGFFALAEPGLRPALAWFSGRGQLLCQRLAPWQSIRWSGSGRERARRGVSDGEHGAFDPGELAGAGVFRGLDHHGERVGHSGKETRSHDLLVEEGEQSLPVAAAHYGLHVDSGNLAGQPSDLRRDCSPSSDQEDRGTESLYRNGRHARHGGRATERLRLRRARPGQKAPCSPSETPRGARSRPLAAPSNRLPRRPKSLQSSLAAGPETKPKSGRRPWLGSAKKP